MNSSGSRTQQRNQQQPQQKGNPEPNNPIQPQNMNSSGSRTQQRNQQPPQQKGSSGPDIPGRSQSMDLGSRFVSEYMRRTYRDLKQDTDQQNT